MSDPIILFWSFRSPYSYVALPRVFAQDPVTLAITPDQPLARRLGRLGAAATKHSQGVSFCLEVSRLLWDGECWTLGSTNYDLPRGTLLWTGSSRHLGLAAVKSKHRVPRSHNQLAH